jgi:hypothetical protein
MGAISFAIEIAGAYPLDLGRCPAHVRELFVSSAMLERSSAA